MPDNKQDNVQQTVQHLVDDSNHLFQWPEPQMGLMPIPLQSVQQTIGAIVDVPPERRIFLDLGGLPEFNNVFDVIRPQDLQGFYHQQQMHQPQQKQKLIQ